MSHTESTPTPRAVGVSVNGVAHRVQAGATLAELIGALGQAPDQFATAVNGEFVARGLRERQVLREGDCVTCFQAIVGG